MHINRFKQEVVHNRKTCSATSLIHLGTSFVLTANSTVIVIIGFVVIKVAYYAFLDFNFTLLCSLALCECKVHPRGSNSFSQLPETPRWNSSLFLLLHDDAIS